MSDGCSSCSGRCCYDIIVPVTPFDAWRIARAQRLQFADFVEPCLTSRALNAGFRLDASDDRYAMILRRHRLEAGACTFLAHVGPDVKRCGIYRDRPLVCRAYPFEIRGGSIDLLPGARCAPTDWNLATLDYAGRRAEFARYGAESEACRRIDAGWNVRPLDDDAALRFAAYLAYAEAVCDRLLAEPDDGAAP
jgi:Fe-S-cluster containining protein